jgi:PAP2 superfamily
MTTRRFGCSPSPMTAGVAALLLALWLGGCATAQRSASPSGIGAAIAGAPETPWAAATSTWQWNDYASDVLTRHAPGQFPAFRTFAYLNLAIHNAIVQAKAQGQEADGAAAGAAAGVLSSLFPKDAAATAARLQRETEALGAKPRARFLSAAETGRQVASQVVALAQGDRASVAWTGTLPVGDDKWSSRQQPPAPPGGANFGAMRTFFLNTPADFRAPPPPPYGSDAFRAEVKRVREVSDTRTNTQLRVAQYWENLTGSFAAGAWNAVARSAMAARGYDEGDTARTLAMMHMVAFDAVLACHDSKYVYWVPRPTQADPQITLAIGVPNFPSYPSNHACISGAVGLLLDAVIPNTKGMYEAMGRQAGDSRIYAGIHYKMDLDAGYEIARKVTARALEVGVQKDRPFAPIGK